MPTPEKSMSSIRKPTEGLGAPWYCSTSPMPRSWKKRGRDVPPAQLRSGTRPSTSSKCWTPAPRSVPSPETAGRAKKIEAVSGPNKSHWYFIHLLPTPVLTGSGSTGSPVHRRLRPIKATPRFKLPTISDYLLNSMPQKLANCSEQTAEDQDDGGQEGEPVPRPAFCGISYVGDRVDFPADQIHRSQPCRDKRV